MAALRQLGLRIAVQPDTLLEAATHAQQLAVTDGDAGHARGRLLLEYLEIEAARLFGGHAQQATQLHRLRGAVSGLLGADNWWVPLGREGMGVRFYSPVNCVNPGRYAGSLPLCSTVWLALAIMPTTCCR